MTTYTLTQAQIERLYKLADPFDNETIGLLTELKPNPAPISKEDMVKVLELLFTASEYLMPDGHKFQGQAITIMQSAIEGMK
jgi:hypothetical protein